MKNEIRLLMAAMVLVLLSGCAGLGSVASPPPPVELANRTVLDEQGALAVELAYKAARLAGETAVDAGLVKGATAQRVAALDLQAYSAVLAVRQAYRAGNAASYAEALVRGQSAITELIAAMKKGT